MKNPMEDLVAIRERYLQYVAVWSKAVDLLIGRIGESAEVAAPKPPRGGLRREFAFTGTRVYCELSYYEPRARLVYGFVALDVCGRERDVVTRTQYINTGGNVFTSLEAGTANHNITIDVTILLAGLHEAVGKSWEGSAVAHG